MRVGYRFSLSKDTRLCLVHITYFTVLLVSFRYSSREFFLTLGIGIILYKLMWIGAGDIKYVAVLSLAIPVNSLLSAYALSAFTGGILAISYLIGDVLTKGKNGDQEGIPYGFAISIGFYLVIVTQFLIKHKTRHMSTL
nr:prepilin peptidase [Vibrio sp. Vb339]